MLKLRTFNFSQEDYEAMAAIRNQSYEDNRMRAKDFKRIDDYTPQDEFDWERTIAEWNGQPVGYGLYTKALWLSEPDLYVVGWLTHPDFRDRGIASAYWDHLEAEVFPLRQIKALIADARGEISASRYFLAKRGFVETEKRTESVLDLASIDLTKYSSLQSSIAEKGIVLMPLSELMVSDPEYLMKLVELGNVLRRDEPRAEDQEPLTEKVFQDYYMSSDTFYPDGWYIAVHQGRYVGWCAVLPNKEKPEHVSNGITVIDREYRRIGLATAMKVQVIAHARSMGATRIRTANISTNPMLKINLALGYTPIRDEFQYRKQLA